jgi:hypothetical protein
MLICVNVVQVCDATTADSSNAADKIKNKIEEICFGFASQEKLNKLNNGEANRIY